MKKINIIALLLFTGFLSAQEAHPFSFTFNHQALPVAKLQETGDFYVHILGFKEIEVTASQTNPKRWVQNHEGKQLHLITSKDGAPNTMINHMAFSTSNFDAFVAHLRKNNITFWTDEGKKNEVRIRADGVRQVKFQDPEGHWIEINETH